MNAWPLADLDIIAYASALEEPVRPRVLPPVYRVRDTPEVILSPPFTLADGQVINPVVLCQQEFEDFVLKEKITPLPQPLAAKARWDLWVNEEGVVAYQPKSEVTQAFEALFTTHLGLARRKLAEKDLAAASRHAEVARSAKPSHLDPLIILGAVELLGAEPGGTGFNFYQHLATRYIEQAEFERLARQQAGQAPVPHGGALAMKGIAMKKSTTSANSSELALAA